MEVPKLPNLSERLKWTLLALIPRFLNEKLLIFYTIFLSRFSALFTKRHHIVSIQKSFELGHKIFQIKCTDGIINIPNIQRVTRFVSGIDFAFTRLFNQYVASPYRGIFHDQGNTKVVFDVGANIGEFSLCVLRYSSTVRVLAFEPDPAAFVCLKLNLEYWLGYNRYLAVCRALSSSTENKTLFVSTKNADTSLIPALETTETIQVRTETLSKYIVGIEPSNVVLLKMDAEGAEPEVLVGAGKHLDRISFLTIDVSPERMGNSTAAQVTQILESQGYDVEMVKGQGKRIFINAKHRER